MTRRGLWLAGALYLAALAAGSVTDRPQPPVRRTIAGYDVLAADFHVHMLPHGWAGLSPWDTVVEASRHGLDVVALTPHEQVWQAKVGQWWSRLIGGPLVIVGEEITAPGYHMIAVGLRDAVSSDQPAAGAIDAIHRQGGVAIAAHPYWDAWPAYDEAARGRLDGTEVVRPESLVPAWAAELRAFAATVPRAAAIGSSDYHGLNPMGSPRTFVFARGRTEADVMEALRARRTVVFDRDRAFGDPALVRAAADQGLPGDVPPPPAAVRAARVFSRWAAALALAAVLICCRLPSSSSRRPAPGPDPSASRESADRPRRSG
jgi:hypothetical protein